MAINTLATATLFMTQLDKIAVQEATTGWMDANAGQVIYNGGSEVKIPKMNVQGMGDYDRDNGYQRGSVTLEYETRKMTQDRGRLFQLDPMDINENNFVTTAGAVMGEFQRTRVIPEIDALKCTWPPLSREQAAIVDKAVAPAFFNVTFTDPGSNSQVTKRFYAGTPTYSVYTYVKGVKTYQGVGVDLIEK